LLRLFPTARLESQWETLTLAGEFDRLLVGRAAPDAAALREEQLRRLVQEGVPLVAVHPAAEAIVMHELAMIQRDVGGLLAPLNPVRQHAGVQRLLMWLRENAKALGPINQLTWQRKIADGAPRAVLAALACDADVLQEIAGKLDRVSAMSPMSADQSLAGLAVNFTGTEQALVHWVSQPVGTATGEVELKVIAAGGQASLLLGPPESEWTLAATLGGVPSEPVRGNVDFGEALLQTVTQLEGDEAPSRWNAACRAAELAEAAQQSLRRGKTIQLHYEEHSEQQTFKSVMAAGGCLILMGLLLLVGVIAVADAVAGPVRQNLWFRLWPLYVFAPVAFFLLLQTLWRVFAATPAKPATAWQRSEGAK
jgi:myo-inositol 2-dehydrogenase/D-chiro-inositol 1-dehydrogenase